MPFWQVQWLERFFLVLFCFLEILIQLVIALIFLSSTQWDTRVFFHWHVNQVAIWTFANVWWENLLIFGFFLNWRTALLQPRAVIHFLSNPLYIGVKHNKNQWTWTDILNSEANRHSHRCYISVIQLLLKQESVTDIKIQGTGFSYARLCASINTKN